MSSYVRIANSVPGTVPGRLRLTVNNLTAVNQLGLIVALRSRNYSSAVTARPIYGAEELIPLDTAALATRAGASGPGTNNVIRHTNLASSWTPVMELRLLAGTYLTHVGNYRLNVRAYSPDGSAVKLRVVWDVGDIILPVENNFDIKQMPGANDFYLLDLGELRLEKGPIAAHRWTAQIQAKGLVGGEDIDIDEVALLCTDEGYVRLRAPQLTATASQASFGPRSGGTLADDSAAGTIAWSNPSNAASSNDSYATAAFTTAATSHYLKATNFGFAIPAGATINGVVVEIEHAGNLSSGIKDVFVKLVKGGAVTGVDHAQGSWPTTDAYATYGGATDLWGSTLTVSDVNASNFGVVLNVTNARDNDTARVDHIRMTVYYTPSTTLPQDAVLFGNQSAYLSWDGNRREDSTGVADGPVSEPRGDLLRAPVAGSEGRVLEVTMLSSMGDFESLPDTTRQALSATATVEACWLFPPGS